MPSRPHGLSKLVDLVTIKNRFSLNVTHKINSLSAIIDLVENGAGSSMLSYDSVYREVIEGHSSAYRIKGQPFSLTVVLVTPTHRSLSLAGHRVLDCIIQETQLFYSEEKWLGAYLRA